MNLKTAVQPRMDTDGHGYVGGMHARANHPPDAVAHLAFHPCSSVFIRGFNLSTAAPGLHSASQKFLASLSLALVVVLLLTLVRAHAADAPRPPMKNLLALSSAQARVQTPATPVPSNVAAALPEPLALPGVPAAVFNDDPNTGIDPFFPHSRRRPARVTRAPGEGAIATTPAPIAARPEPPRPSPSALNLVLRGIVGPAHRRLALISTTTRTFDVKSGEELAMRAGTADVRVTCVEIRERSVIVRVEGEPTDRELLLKDGI